MSTSVEKGNDAPDALDIGATTAEKFDTNDVESTKEALAGTARVVDHHAEQALCRKFDYRLLPVLAIMCRHSLVVIAVTAANSYFQTYLMLSTRATWAMPRPMASVKVSCNLHLHTHAPGRIANML